MSVTAGQRSKYLLMGESGQMTQCTAEDKEHLLRGTIFA